MLKTIAKLNEERYGLTFDRLKATGKLLEEVNEFIDAEDNDYETIDALCDIIVIATGEIRKKGYCPEKALDETITEITSRKQDPEQKAQWDKFGRVDGEKWVKDKTQTNCYKADYSKARCDD
jgi:5'-deoxynucleotidase YfbR-like HD superfamily hydrolase